MKFEKILVPIDGSYISEIAADLAISSAPVFNAKLTFIYVIDSVKIERSVSSEMDRLIEESEGKIALERAKKAASDHGLDVETKIYEGIPYKVICELSKSFNQIIMSVKGKTGSKLIGGTAEKCIENSFCPILTLRSGSRRIENILLPVSDKNIFAIEVAIDTAKIINGKITVFSVGGDAQAVVEAVSEKCRAQGIPVDTKTGKGNPAEEICALSGIYDLIIMGTSGKKGFKRIFSGSVAEEVMAKASCPVTIVRNKE